MYEFVRKIINLIVPDKSNIPYEDILWKLYDAILSAILAGYHLIIAF